MMTVLNTVEIMDVNPWVVRLVICMIVFGISSILWVVFKPFDNGHIVAFVMAILCGLLAIIGVVVFPEVPTGKFQIEATFTDDFPFTSVMKEYDVIEQRGDIFLLEPKEREVD